MNCVLDQVVLIIFLQLLIKFAYCFISLFFTCFVINAHFHFYLFIELSLLFLFLILGLSIRGWHKILFLIFIIKLWYDINVDFLKNCFLSPDVCFSRIFVFEITRWNYHGQRIRPYLQIRTEELALSISKHYFLRTTMFWYIYMNPTQQFVL